MKLSTEFYDQLNSIENFKELDYNDPQVVAIRMRADHELESMDNRRPKIVKPKRARRIFLYEFYQGKEVIAKGTAKEIAIALGMKEPSINQMSTPSFHKFVNKNKGRYAKKVGVVE